jgi:hypothetical protein
VLNSRPARAPQPGRSVVEGARRRSPVTGAAAPVVDGRAVDAAAGDAANEYGVRPPAAEGATAPVLGHPALPVDATTSPSLEAVPEQLRPDRQAPPSRAELAAARRRATRRAFADAPLPVVRPAPARPDAETIEREYERIRRLAESEELWRVDTPGGAVVTSEGGTPRTGPAPEPRPTLGGSAV